MRSNLQSPLGLFFVYFGRKQRRIFIDIRGELMIPYMRLVCDNQKVNLDQEETDRKGLFF